MRLILPDMDKDRSAYGVKETQLGKDYVNVLGLDAKKSEDALKLLNYKTPSICGPVSARAISPATDPNPHHLRLTGCRLLVTLQGRLVLS